MKRPLCSSTRARIWSHEAERVPCANVAIDASGRCHVHHARTEAKTAERQRTRAIAVASTLSLADLEALVLEARRK